MKLFTHWLRGTLVMTILLTTINVAMHVRQLESMSSTVDELEGLGTLLSSSPLVRKAMFETKSDAATLPEAGLTSKRAQPTILNQRPLQPLHSTCSFQQFPSPTPESKLPWIFDAFANHNGTQAIFVAIHRGQIDKSFQDSDSSLLSNHTTGESKFFSCVFFDAERPHETSTLVRSDPVHRPGYGHMPQNRENEWTFVITCPIPKQLQHNIFAGQQETSLHVHLQAYESDLFKDIKQTGGVGPTTNATTLTIPEAVPLNRISTIPLCHSTSQASPSLGNMSPLKQKNFHLMAHTRIKSAYSYFKTGKPIQDANYRVHDWIAYHRYQGVDHFIIYDNDPNDHGPLEEELRPYINQGIVTRVWNPLEESYRKHKKNSQTCHTQGATGVSALLRFGFASHYFANLDIDEFFLPTQKGVRVIDMVRKTLSPTLGASQPVDGMRWSPHVMTYCNGTILPPKDSDKSQHPVSELDKQCMTNQRRSGPKLIFWSDRILLYHTHNAFLTRDGNKPRIKPVYEDKGFLAHMRRGVQQQRHVLPDTGETLLVNTWTKRVDYLDSFLESYRLNRTMARSL